MICHYGFSLLLVSLTAYSMVAVVLSTYSSVVLFAVPSWATYLYSGDDTSDKFEELVVS